MRTSKLMDGIDLGLSKEYNPAKVFIDSKDSKISDVNKIGQVENEN